ncbi:CHRD domain-containing protein [Duganella sp.]|uniref:CHRD domain-containing protein n=1 Tax=Duganella sp. TaxID=1904440 RepID=UPI0031D6F8DF
MKQHVRNWAAAALLCIGAAAASLANAATYSTILTGAKEMPANSSDGIGAAALKFDPNTHVLELGVAFAGLLGQSTAAHIHCCTADPGAGLAGAITPSFAGFPLGVTTGAYSRSFDTSLVATWNPLFLSANGGTTAGAEAAFFAGLNAGTAYLNIHSMAEPDGEIRGFFAPITAVPEPAGFAMLGLGLPAVLLLARRRKST